MKQLSAFRYLLFLLSFAVVFSCGDDKKKDDPSPIQYRISVRVTAQGIQALSPRIRINSEYDFAGVRGNFKQGPVINDSFTTASVDKTYDMGTFGDYDLVEADLSTSSPPTGSAYFKAVILVDGVERASVTMNAANPGKTHVEVETDDL